MSLAMLDTLIYWDLPSQNGSSSAVWSVYENPSDAVTCPLTYKTIHDPEWGYRPNALPFIFQDFRFLSTQGGAEVVLFKQHWSDTAMEPPRAIAYVEIRVRKQKNNDNYQKLLYARLDDDTFLCILLPGTLPWPSGHASSDGLHHKGSIGTLSFHHWHQCEKVPSETCAYGVQPSFR